MNSALASLTEQYTDSENEDHHDSDEERLYSDPEEMQIKGEIVSRTSSKALRLVSYNDNEMHEDEDEAHGGDADIEERLTEEIDSASKYEKYTKKYGFALPPEPKTKSNPKLQEMVSTIVQKIELKPDYDLNQYIQQKKSFRNPSIYDKLIQFCGLNELGTNFPKDFYDTSVYGPESYFEELAKAQKIEMEKQEKQKKENIKTEILEGVSKESEWRKFLNQKLI